MHLYGADLILSATDLASFLGCRHRTALDMAVAHGDRKRPYNPDPLLEILWKRGAEHEKAYVESLRKTRDTLADLADAGDSAARVEATLTEMRKWTQVIVQGALSDGRWLG